MAPFHLLGLYNAQQKKEVCTEQQFYEYFMKSYEHSLCVQVRALVPMHGWVMKHKTMINKNACEMRYYTIIKHSMTGPCDCDLVHIRTHT